MPRLSDKAIVHGLIQQKKESPYADSSFRELVGRRWQPHDFAIAEYCPEPRHPDYKGFGASVEDDYSETSESSLGERWI